jgi:hypothetical protein
LLSWAVMYALSFYWILFPIGDLQTPHLLTPSLPVPQLEKRVREHAGDKEPAWESAGKKVGIQVWRIEQFHVKAWKDVGSFYDGDSYIVLHVSQTYHLIYQRLTSIGADL